MADTSRFLMSGLLQAPLVRRGTAKHAAGRRNADLVTHKIHDHGQYLFRDNTTF